MLEISSGQYMGTHTCASEQHTHIQKHSNNKQHGHLLSQKNVCSNHGTFMELTTKAKIAIVGMGMKKSSPDQVRKAMKGAINAGYCHVDCICLSLQE